MTETGNKYFCTYFDVNYLPRALALHASLLRVAPSVQLFALCLDDECFRQVKQAGRPGLHVIDIRDLEAADPALAASKVGRTRVEYYFSCVPSLALYLLERHPEIDLLWSVDADIFFYSDPEPMFREMEGASIGIVDHRHPQRFASREKFGKYNVGLVAFRHDEQAFEAIRWWRERCIEWCYERLEETRYADQKYLNAFPEKFKGVRVLQHKGINVAPWNLANYRVHEVDGKVFVDEQPLIFFHFHGFKQIRPWLFDMNLARSGARVTRVFRRLVAAPYAKELMQAAAGLGYSTRSLRRHDARSGRLVASTRGLVRRLMNLSPKSYLVLFRGQPV